MKRVRTVLGLTAVLVVLGSTYVFASGQKQAPESSAAGSTEINLTYWGWGPHVDAVNNEIGPAFTKMHPNVHITATSFGPFDLMDKFYVSIATGKGAPDVAILVRRLAGKYMIPTLLYDFTSFVEKYKSDFPPALLGDVTSVDGKILSIPPDYGPGVLFYDKSLADKLGIDVSKIKTWDDYYQLGLRITRDDPTVYIQPNFVPGGSWGSNQWRLFAGSAGGNIFNKDNKVIRNNAVLQKVTEFYYKLNTDLHVAKGQVNDPAIYDQLRKGNLLFWPSNSYKEMEIAQQAPDLKGKIYALPWPLWSNDAPKLTGVWGGVALVVPKAGPHADVAAQFAEFYATNADALTKLFFSTAGVPAFAPVRNKILGITDQATFSPNLIQSIDAREVSPWNFTDWAQTEKILGDGLDSMFAGKVSPQDAWPYIEKQLINTLGR